MSLFPETTPPKPLAERMRPQSLDQVLGQEQARDMLAAFIEEGAMPSVIFHGPPGSGKTTLSRLMASLLGWEGRSLNATSASVKDIRELAREAKELWKQIERRTLLFIDEIHRLNKSQQDVLLPIVESGALVLAGSTTENPFFALNQALRSRVQLIKLEPLPVDTIVAGLKRVQDSLEVAIDEPAMEWVAIRAAGDLRLAYTTIESAAFLARRQAGSIDVALVRQCLSQTQMAGDRKGDNHYDLASAFQKSLRGSDADAAIYYLARFLETGEDPRFIARRLLVTASEDVGNADPRALLVAESAFRAVEVLGLPEGRIPLAQATLYVAQAPKSNESVKALGAASKLLKSRPLDPIPAHLRDSHYQGSKEMGHGAGYIYSHDHPEQYQDFLPSQIQDFVFVNQENGDRDISSQDLDSVLERVVASGGGAEWFEADADHIAAQMGWPVGKLRKVLNQLVKSKRIEFKRLFRIQ